MRRAAVALCGFLAIVFVAANLFCIPDGAWAWQFDARFDSGKLRGIHFFSNHVEGAEALLAYMKPRLRRGETLLTFYEAPMINYLTDTRQALCTGLPSRNWPEEVRAQFVARMIERGRAPRYAVNLGGVTMEPIYDFVRLNYAPAAKFGPFIVWRARGARGR